jgi:two-component system phosphate regulon sensor histidine kinase PhoR
MISSGMTKEEETIKFANIIHKEGVRLLGQIDSIINLSHLEEKSLESDYEALDIYDIIETILSQLKFRASDKNVKLNISREHYEFRGNRRMIEELIINLVDNGIKYNHENGSVDVIIRKKDKSLSITVKDTGIGIPIKDQNRVFERFFMVDKSRSKKVQGTGLGLSIVKHIVEYHGGSISLKSELNKGTEIEVLLPI